MIRAKYFGVIGFGNRLFTYALARILAEELGYYLMIPAVPGFPATKERVRGQSHDQPIERLAGHDNCIRDILTDRSPRQIFLKGAMSLNWERDLAPYEDFIRYYFDPNHRLKPPTDPFTPEPSDLVVHLRVGDFNQLGYMLPSAYYKKLLPEIEFDRLVVVAEPAGLTDQILEPFKPWNPLLVSGHWYRDFSALLGAKKLVMSQSTFSWWAAFLGEAEKVFFPLTNRGWFSEEFPAVDLRINSSRYHYVKVT